jgi:hypothetical protein
MSAPAPIRLQREYADEAMALPPLVWTTEGDREYLDRGPFRATVLTSPLAAGAVAIRIRIGLRGADDGEDTPVYVQVPAGELSRQLASLKADAEEELRIRVAHLEIEGSGEDEEKTDEVLTSPASVPSAGFYLTRPPRGRR